MNYTIETYYGKECLVFCHEIASIRIQVFREFPYLYDGNYEYELEYLNTFFSSEKSILIIAKHKGTVIGISTGIPLKDETENIKSPWYKNGHPVEDIFYFGESAIEKTHRGYGIGHQFFKLREEWAKKNGYKKTTFCCIIRPEDHKHKPKNHKTPESFWNKLGYQKGNITCILEWKEIDEEKESLKNLNFWHKKI